MGEKNVQTYTAGTKTVYGSRVGRPTADIAHERCETLALLAESTVQLSPEPMVRCIAERFGSDDVYLYHYRQDGVFVAHASRKGSPYIELLTQSLNDTPGLAHLLVYNSEPIIVDYRGSRSGVDVPRIIQELDYTCSLLLPVVHGGELFGVVRIMYRGTCPWRHEDADYLRQVGRLLGASASRIYKSEKEAELNGLRGRLHGSVVVLAGVHGLHADFGTAS